MLGWATGNSNTQDSTRPGFGGSHHFPPYSILPTFCHYRGQNPLVWKVSYIIGKLLKHKCLKWAHITHLNIWNTSYDQKKGRESNWQFDFRPLKVRNWLDLLVFKECATYRWNFFDKGYNFAFNLIAIIGLHVKLWAPNLRESQLWKILGLPGQNAI